MNIGTLKQYKSVLMVAVLGATALLSGCETISGNSIGFPVRSKPEGAQVNVVSANAKHDFACTTPCHLHLRQTHDYTVTIQKNGYAKRVIAVKSDGSVEGAAGSFGSNLLLFGIGAPIGMIVDAASGGDDRLFPGSVDVKLIKAINNGKQINVAGAPNTRAKTVVQTTTPLKLPAYIRNAPLKKTPAATAPTASAVSVK